MSRDQQYNLNKIQIWYFPRYSCIIPSRGVRRAGRELFLRRILYQFETIILKHSSTTKFLPSCAFLSSSPSIFFFVIHDSFDSWFFKLFNHSFLQTYLWRITGFSVKAVRWQNSLWRCWFCTILDNLFQVRKNFYHLFLWKIKKSARKLGWKYGSVPLSSEELCSFVFSLLSHRIWQCTHGVSSFSTSSPARHSRIPVSSFTMLSFEARVVKRHWL